MIINVPRILGIKNIKIYSFFSEIYYKLKKEKNKIIEVNFSKTSWVDPSMCSVLAMLFDYFIENNMLKFKLTGLNEVQVKLFQNNNFISQVLISNKENYENVSIKLATLRAGKSENIKVYLKKELEVQKFIYEKNVYFRKLTRSLSEIYKNSSMHGNAKFVYICGHYFPEKKVIIFTLCNMGETFRTNYRKKINYNFVDDLSAIRYSLKKYSSSRINSESGGLGLNYVLDFLNEVLGEMIIYSGNAMYTNSIKNLESEYLFDKTFPGTVISIRVPLTEKFYEKGKEVKRIKEIILL